jgi:hypothetical protein
MESKNILRSYDAAQFSKWLPTFDWQSAASVLRAEYGDTGFLGYVGDHMRILCGVNPGERKVKVTLMSGY